MDSWALVARHSVIRYVPLVALQVIPLQAPRRRGGWVAIAPHFLPKRKKLKRRRSSIHSKEVYKNISVVSREFRQDSYLIGKQPIDVDCRNSACLIDVDTLLASTSIRHAEFERFCGIMGLPPPVSKRAYNGHLKKIRNVAVDTTYNVMIDAANRLRDIVEKEEPSKVYTDEGGRTIVDFVVTVLWELAEKGAHI